MTNVFERYEKKYVLSNKQFEAFKNIIRGKVCRDKYGKYTIYNIYYDTENYDIIRRSTEKPLYKEKLRLRSYESLIDKDIAFLELKKKYNGIVYKRRTEVRISEVEEILRGKPTENQILKEIMFYQKQHPVKEKVFISYDREAFAGIYDEDLRITFDSNIRFRQNNLSLTQGCQGTKISDNIVMEIKVSGAIPLWLCSILSQLDIVPASFSKYGECYTEFICGSAKKSNDKKERVAS